MLRSSSEQYSYKYNISVSFVTECIRSTSSRCNSSTLKLNRRGEAEGGREQSTLSEGGKAHLCERGALDVLDGFQLAREALAGVLRERLLAAARELLARGRVVAQVRLRAHQQERRLRAVVFDLGHPLRTAPSSGTYVLFLECFTISTQLSQCTYALR